MVNPRGYEDVTPLYVDIDPETYKVERAVIEAAKDARAILDRWAKEPLHMLVGEAIICLSGPLDALLAAEREE